MGYKEFVLPPIDLDKDQTDYLHRYFQDKKQKRSLTQKSHNMVHLIGSKNSTCTQRVLTVLAEKGVTDWTIYEPDFMTGEHKVDHEATKRWLF
jgi:hypothetical protein